MTTIARHRESGSHYLVLGGGYGAHATTTTGWFGFENLKADQMPMVLVANEVGDIGWLKSNDIELVSIDGISPARALQPQDQPPGQ